MVRALDTARYIADTNRFVALQQGVNEVLSMVGLRVNDQGQMTPAKQARTLDEVAELAGRLRGELIRRGVHAEVTRYCEEELLRRSIFHAVFEATKGLSQRLRQMSGSVLDGSELVDACFAKQAPVIRINGYTTKSEISEQSGFANMLRGIAGTFRNPPAHQGRGKFVRQASDLVIQAGTGRVVI